MEENDSVETVITNYPSREDLKKNVSSLSQDDQIRKYIHKKFRKPDQRKLGENSNYLDENHSIKKITIYHENDAGTSNKQNIPNKQCDEGQQPVVPIRQVLSNQLKHLILYYRNNRFTQKSYVKDFKCIFSGNL